MHLNRGPNNQQSFQSMKNWFRRTSLTHVRRQHFELVVDCLICEFGRRQCVSVGRGSDGRVFGPRGTLHPVGASIATDLLKDDPESHIGAPEIGLRAGAKIMGLRFDRRPPKHAVRVSSHYLVYHPNPLGRLASSQAHRRRAGACSYQRSQPDRTASYDVARFFSPLGAAGHQCSARRAQLPLSSGELQRVDRPAPAF